MRHRVTGKNREDRQAISLICVLAKKQILLTFKLIDQQLSFIKEKAILPAHHASRH